jgi:phosphoglucan,water dikinase
MIHIGNQTSWAARPAEPFEYAVANGFDAFEWFPDKKPEVGWDERDLNGAERGRIRDVAKEKGIRLSVHARWQANPLHTDALELLRKDIELAKDLSAVLLNIHLYHEAGIERFVAAITPLVQQTADAGLQLSIENTPEHSPEEFNELFRRLGELDSTTVEHVGMCLDLGHANLSGATRNNYLAFVDRLNTEVPIIHLHLHENWGDGDTHLTLFTGPASRNDSGIRGFIERMRKREFSGSIIFEQWPQPPTLLNQARERLLGLLKCDDKEKPRREHSGAVSDSNGAVGTPRPTTAAEVGRGVPTAPQPANDVKAHSFYESLVEGDKRSKSWREKLDAVRKLIVSKAHLEEGELVYEAIYLRFLSAGQIACVEDGRHFRPGHHARISQEIQERIAKVSTPENAYIIRKIYAALPSSAEAFQRAEPLTRIRDIAHRNDIPSELKQEIKTTLQNKLHRCAGPEDLETSKKLLERITVPGANYSAEFVEQFRIFHEELKEFFNARTLDERLNALISAIESEQAERIHDFLAQKSKSGFEEQISTLKHLSELRDWLRSTIRKQSNGERQDFMLADIGLEDFAFVLVSQLINAFESSEPRRSGVELLEPLALIIQNLVLSGISADECCVIGAELNAWRENFDAADREQLLRMKATIERCRLVGESFSERVIGSLLSRAEELGRALGVTEHAIRVFCEAEIRSHLVFQLSKIVSLLLKRIRDALELPAWDVLVSGRALGQVKVFDRLGQMADDGSEPVIAVLKKAEGDEEIPNRVKGILLGHEIPHLSHLGVRARQAGVVFVSAEDDSKFEALEKFKNETVQLEAAPDRVEWKFVEEIDTAERSEVTRVRLGKVRSVALREGDSFTLSFNEVTVEKAGQKSFGLRELRELSSNGKNGFLVPDALVIPFGVMEKMLSANKGLSEEYRKLAGELNDVGHEFRDFKVADSDSDPNRGRARGIVEQLRAIIEQLEVPDEIKSAISKTFGGERLMVRSSANCEDLEDFAGAGLYESIPNVDAGDVTSAIRQVWSSLWTRRAVLSRRQAGIPHEQAQMAVIIQQMIAPEFSFVLHTVNPLSRNADEVYAEIAVGLGETLASAAARGTPYRLVCDKKTVEVQTVAFANFNYALRADSRGGAKRELVDYSRVPLSRESGLRRDLGRRFAAIGIRVENEFGKAQDIEGAIMGNDIYLVQSRPQQGL